MQIVMVSIRFPSDIQIFCLFHARDKVNFIYCSYFMIDIKMNGEFSKDRLTSPYFTYI